MKKVFLLICFSVVLRFAHSQPVMATDSARQGFQNIDIAVNPADSVTGNLLSSRQIADTLQQPGWLPNTPTRFTPGQLYVPGVLALTGLVTTTLFQDQVKFKIASLRKEHLGSFHTNVDDYLQYAPIPIAYGLDIAGIPSKNDLWNRSLILLKGEALMFVAVNIVKHASKELRPDGSNFYSFPSGHTAQAFAAASFLSEEYKDRLPWIPYVAYGLSGATGLLRIANNKHYIGDVLIGAAMGLVSMKVAYWTHQYKWNKAKLHVRAVP